MLSKHLTGSVLVGGEGASLEEQNNFNNVASPQQEVSRKVVLLGQLTVYSF